MSQAQRPVVRPGDDEGKLTAVERQGDSEAHEVVGQSRPRPAEERKQSAAPAISAKWSEEQEKAFFALIEPPESLVSELKGNKGLTAKGAVSGGGVAAAAGLAVEYGVGGALAAMMGPAGWAILGAAAATGGVFYNKTVNAKWKKPEELDSSNLIKFVDEKLQVQIQRDKLPGFLLDPHAIRAMVQNGISISLIAALADPHNNQLSADALNTRESDHAREVRELKYMHDALIVKVFVEEDGRQSVKPEALKHYLRNAHAIYAEMKAVYEAAYDDAEEEAHQSFTSTGIPASFHQKIDEHLLDIIAAGVTLIDLDHAINEWCETPDPDDETKTVEQNVDQGTLLKKMKQVFDEKVLEGDNLPERTVALALLLNDDVLFQLYGKHDNFTDYVKPHLAALVTAGFDHKLILKGIGKSLAHGKTPAQKLADALWTQYHAGGPLATAEAKTRYETYRAASHKLGLRDAFDRRCTEHLAALQADGLPLAEIETATSRSRVDTVKALKAGIEKMPEGKSKDDAYVKLRELSGPETKKLGTSVGADDAKQRAAMSAHVERMLQGKRGTEEQKSEQRLLAGYLKTMLKAEKHEHGDQVKANVDERLGVALITVMRRRLFKEQMASYKRQAELIKGELADFGNDSERVASLKSEARKQKRIATQLKSLMGNSRQNPALHNDLKGHLANVPDASALYAQCIVQQGEILALTLVQAGWKDKARDFPALVKRSIQAQVNMRDAYYTQDGFNALNGLNDHAALTTQTNYDRTLVLLDEAKDSADQPSATAQGLVMSHQDDAIPTKLTSLFNRPGFDFLVDVQEEDLHAAGRHLVLAYQKEKRALIEARCDDPNTAEPGTNVDAVIRASKAWVQGESERNKKAYADETHIRGRRLFPGFQRKDTDPVSNTQTPVATEAQAGLVFLNVDANIQKSKNVRDQAKVFDSYYSFLQPMSESYKKLCRDTTLSQSYLGTLKELVDTVNKANPNLQEEIDRLFQSIENARMRLALQAEMLRRDECLNQWVSLHKQRVPEDVARTDALLAQMEAKRTEVLDEIESLKKANASIKLMRAMLGDTGLFQTVETRARAEKADQKDSAIWAKKVSESSHAAESDAAHLSLSDEKVTTDEVYQRTTEFVRRPLGYDAFNYLRGKAGRNKREQGTWQYWVPFRDAKEVSTIKVHNKDAVELTQPASTATGCKKDAFDMVMIKFSKRLEKITGAAGYSHKSVQEKMALLHECVRQPVVKTAKNLDSYGHKETSKWLDIMYQAMTRPFLSDKVTPNPYYAALKDWKLEGATHEATAAELQEWEAFMAQNLIKKQIDEGFGIHGILRLVSEIQNPDNLPEAVRKRLGEQHEAVVIRRPGGMAGA